MRHSATGTQDQEQIQHASHTYLLLLHRFNSSGQAQYPLFTQRYSQDLQTNRQFWIIWILNILGHSNRH